MIEIIYSVAGFVAAIAVLVTFHEFGHFCVARLFGIRVLTFSVGFGKPLWSHRFDRSGTELVIGAVPLGGYVKMFEASGDSQSSESHSTAFNSKSLGIRASVVLAGPLANFLLAAVLSWAVFLYGVPGLEPIVSSVAPSSLGESKGFAPGARIVAIDGRETESWNQHQIYLMNQVANERPIVFELESPERDSSMITIEAGEIPSSDWQQAILETGLGLRPDLPRVPAIVGDVLAGSPAFNGGLMAGDRIVAIDDIVISDWSQLVTAISGKPNEYIQLKIVRNDMPMSIALRAEAYDSATGLVGRIGIRAVSQYEPPVIVKMQLLEGFGAALESTWLLSVLTVRAIGTMVISGRVAENLGGPVTIARAAGQSARIGLTPFLFFLAILSVSLAILNLLPIPVLDGGHLVYLIIEAIKGSPLSPRARHVGQQIGLSAVAAIMLIAIYNDMVRLEF